MKQKCKPLKIIVEINFKFINLDVLELNIKQK